MQSELTLVDDADKCCFDNPGIQIKEILISEGSLYLVIVYWSHFVMSQCAYMCMHAFHANTLCMQSCRVHLWGVYPQLKTWPFKAQSYIEPMHLPPQRCSSFWVNIHYICLQFNFVTPCMHTQLYRYSNSCSLSRCNCWYFCWSSSCSCMRLYLLCVSLHAFQTWK